MARKVSHGVLRTYRRAYGAIGGRRPTHLDNEIVIVRLARVLCTSEWVVLKGGKGWSSKGGGAGGVERTTLLASQRGGAGA